MVFVGKFAIFTLYVRQYLTVCWCAAAPVAEARPEELI